MAKEKNSDRLIKALVAQGVTVFYGVQGGACAHLIQSVVDCGGTYCPVLNEQSAGYACHGYYCATGKTAGIIVTTGPGVTNVVSGVAACFYDRVPLVVLTGQVAATQRRAPELGLRMYGFQEADHLGLLRPIVDHAREVGTLAELEDAITLIGASRGQVLHLDVHDDLQRELSEVGPASTAAASPRPSTAVPAALDAAIAASARPVLILGYGAGLPGDLVPLVAALEQKNVPVLATWRQQALLSAGKNVFLFGNHCAGDGNALLRRADLVISIGAGLLQHQAGKNFAQFAPAARMFVVDNNDRATKRAELDFGSRCTGWLSDGAAATAEVARRLSAAATSWAGETIARKVGALRQAPGRLIAECINTLEPAFVFADAGATLSWTYQAVFSSQKAPPPVLTSFNLHAMGYAAAAAFGAAHGARNSKMLAVCGDGGFMMNPQDALEMARTSNTRLLIVDNQGYGIIRQTQNDFFDRRHIGSAFSEPGSLPHYNIASVVRSMGMVAVEVTESDERKDLESAFRFADHQVVVLHVRPEYGVEGALRPDGLQEQRFLSD